MKKCKTLKIIATAAVMATMFVAPVTAVERLGLITTCTVTISGDETVKTCTCTDSWWCIFRNW